MNDAKEILQLQRVAYESEAKIYDDPEIPPLTETLPQIKALFSNHTFLKATVDGKIVGSVRASINNGSCHIGRLIVSPEHQNQGIGKKLLAAIEQQYPNCRRFELFTGIKSAKNIRLYEKARYKAFKTEAVSNKLSLICFEKVK
ncbi:MAG TPA: GNAT family N-acetyltransferase [Candidatus Acidoferrales bacterium]|nr:GNAT family N-acetyltransferase [Candidatus Acidoferrales bacterium]